MWNFLLFNILINSLPLICTSSAINNGIIGKKTDQLSTVSSPKGSNNDEISTAIGGCKWFGTAPFCIESCPSGYDYIRSHNGRCDNGTACPPDPSFGNTCLDFMGMDLNKKYCCRSDPVNCAWAGRWTGSHDAFNFYCRYDAEDGACGRLDCSVNSSKFQSHSSSLIAGDNCDELNMWNLNGKATCAYIAWFDGKGQLKNSWYKSH